MFTKRPTSGRLRINKITLPTYIEAMKPQKSRGSCWISSGPGVTPCTIMAASSSAATGTPGTPSASIGTKAPEVAALFADSGPATPATAPLPNSSGRGAVAGVAGPESANNAATSGAFVPMLALGVPGVPVAALLLAAMMVHGVTPGPLLIQQDPRLFWGFIASMYVGNVILLILNLPLVGLFVNLLRVPYPVMYPIILVCSILGVYAVNSSVVDVWIMLGTGVLGYLLRKLDFETAPIVLGLVLAPMMELSLRQALAMSAGHYAIFVTRPISLTLLAVGALLVALALRPLISRTLDWRSRLPAET